MGIRKKIRRRFSRINADKSNKNLRHPRYSAANYSFLITQLEMRRRLDKRKIELFLMNGFIARYINIAEIGFDLF